MQPALLDLLQRQLRDGFPDFTGTEATVTIPIAERLVNEAIAPFLPNGGKIREVRVRAEEGDRLTAEIRLSGPRFLPAIPVRFAIDEQPQLPERPVVGLRLMSSGVVAMAASLMPSLTALTPGIAVDGDRIRIDIRRLLADHDLERWLDYVTDIRVSTRAGAIVLSVVGAIRPK